MSLSGLKPTTRTELEARAEGHSPTPYRVHGVHPDNAAVYLEAACGREIAILFAGGDFEQARKDAAFIVMACNSYDAMKAALEAVEWSGMALSDSRDGELACACPSCEALDSIGTHAADCQLAAALRLARGEQVCGADPVKSGQQSVEQGGADGRMLPVSGAPSNSALRAENEQLRAALDSAPRPEHLVRDENPVAYMDWFFNIRVAALSTQEKQP